MTNLGKRLALLRRQKDLSQAELARLLNLGQSTIAMYERGKRSPDYQTLQRLADFFSVSLDYLLGREEESGTAMSPPQEVLSEPQHRGMKFFSEPLTTMSRRKKSSISDPRFTDLLWRVAELTEDEKESLLEHWEWALQVIERERERRNKRT